MGVFSLIALQEGIEGFAGRLPRLGHANFVNQTLGIRLLRLGQVVEDVDRRNVTVPTESGSSSVPSLMRRKLPSGLASAPLAERVSSVSNDLVNF